MDYYYEIFLMEQKLLYHCYIVNNYPSDLCINKSMQTMFLTLTNKGNTTT